MNILYCGYREWALTIYESITNRFGVGFELVTSKEELADRDISGYDLILFIGWSWIIPADIVNKKKCVCFHPSPLPKYRGGSPLQNQIIAGETESMVSLFLMDEGLDTGPIITQEPFSLKGDLQDILIRMIGAGITALDRFLKEYIKTGELNTTPQDNSQATTFKRRTKSMSEITIEEIQSFTSEQLYNKIRCLQDPYPNAFIKCKDGKKLFITKANPEV